MHIMNQTITDKYIIDTIDSIDYVDINGFLVDDGINSGDLVPAMRTRKTNTLLRVNGWDIYNGVAMVGKDIIIKPRPKLSFMVLSDSFVETDDSNNVLFLNKLMNDQAHKCRVCGSGLVVHPSDLSLVCLPCSINNKSDIEQRVSALQETKDVNVVRNMFLSHVFNEVLIRNDLEQKGSCLGVFGNYLLAERSSLVDNFNGFTIFSDYDKESLIDSILEDFCNGIYRKKIGISFFEGKKLIQAYVDKIYSEEVTERLVPGYASVITSDREDIAGQPILESVSEIDELEFNESPAESVE